MSTAPRGHSPLAKWDVLLLVFRSRLKINFDEVISCPQPCFHALQRDSKMQTWPLGQARAWLPFITPFRIKMAMDTQSFSDRPQSLLPGHFSTSELVLVLGPVVLSWVGTCAPSVCVSADDWTCLHSSSFPKPLLTPTLKPVTPL